MRHWYCSLVIPLEVAQDWLSWLDPAENTSRPPLSMAADRGLSGLGHPVIVALSDSCGDGWAGTWCAGWRYRRRRCRSGPVKGAGSSREAIMWPPKLTSRQFDWSHNLKMGIPLTHKFRADGFLHVAAGRTKGSLCRRSCAKLSAAAWR